MEHIFKSNIQCGNCKAKVAHVLDQNQTVTSWEVDLLHPDRTLKVESTLSRDEVISLVKMAGFTAS